MIEEFEVLEEESADQTVYQTGGQTDADDLYQRLTDWASITDEREQAQLAAEELIPVAEELAPVIEELGVIKAVVQAISDFFQEDDHDVLVDIRDDLSGLREYLEEQQQPESIVNRPLLTTNFVDYTVTEGLLLLILFFLVVRWLVEIVKEAFSWLLW